MFFEIKPFNGIEKHSFYLSGHYLSKDTQKNNIIGWAWELSDCHIVIDGKTLDDNLPKKQLKKIYRDIQLGRTIAQYQRCLNKNGELFLYDVFDKVGDFKFSIYEEDCRPSNFIKKINIKDLKAGLIINTDITFLVVNKV